MNILDKFALSASDVNIPKMDSAQLVTNVLNLFYFIAGVVAVIVIIIAGFNMTVSGNNPSSVSKARNAIMYAVVGLIVVLLAFTITHFVIGRF